MASAQRNQAEAGFDAGTSQSRSRTRQGGFTLIEVMVVVLAIGILLAIARPTLGATQVVTADQAAQHLLATANATFNSVLATQEENQLNWNCVYTGVACSNGRTTQQLLASVNPSETWSTSGNGAGSTNTTTIAFAPWNGLGQSQDGIANADYAAEFMVSTSKGACWFIVEHSANPTVYGYIHATCDKMNNSGSGVCWPENPVLQGTAPNLTLNPFSGTCGAWVTNDEMATSLNGFPPDPNA